MQGWALTRKGDKRLLHYALGGMAFFAVIAAASFCMSAGISRGLPLPGVVLANLPFFGNARTPARAMVMVYLFLSLVWRSLRDGAHLPHSRARAVMALTVLLMVLDFTPASLGATPVACPRRWMSLRGDPGRLSASWICRAAMSRATPP